MNRPSILEKLRAKIAARQPIIGGGAGTGISAKCEEAGGIDLIVIYNSGRYRMAGRGSLAGLMAYGNANQVVKEMAFEVLTAVKHTPVLAGVNGTDPFMIAPHFLRELKDLGFAGIQNFPTVGLCDGVFRANLEETGMSYQQEVEVIALAREMDLLTTPYAFNVAEAEMMTKAGADVVVAHMGLTTSGSIGAHTAKSLDDSVHEVQAIADACHALRDDVIILCHGGPIAMPDDAAYVLQRTRNVHGFYGGEFDGTAADGNRHHRADQTLHRREVLGLACPFAPVMPIIRTSEGYLSPVNRPAWSNATSGGIFSVRREGARFDRHFHDSDEYWLVFSGKAKVLSENVVYYVQRGDIVCTQRGEEHDVLEVYEDLEGFWFEGETAPGGRVGHLHRDAEKARGHDVPGRPVPVDFPWKGNI